MRLRLLSIPLVVLAVLVAGCGDDDDGGASGDVNVGELVDNRSDAEVEADIALAEEAVLRLSDLPDGWEATEAEADDPSAEAEDDETTHALFQCLEIPEADWEVIENDRAEADSDDFDLEDASASSSISVFPSEEFAAAVFSPFESPGFEDCFRRLAQEEFAKGVAEEGEEVPGLVIDEVSIAEFDFADLGDQQAAYRLSVRATVGEFDFQTESDFIAFRVGRCLISVELSGVDGPFDPALAEELAGIAVDRAEAI